MCSLETLESIYENPAPHMEMLRPWHVQDTGKSPEDLGVFSRQLQRWKEFRNWQRDNRGSDTEVTFPVFLDDSRRDFESRGCGNITTEPYFEETMQRIWQQELNRRWHERMRLREVPDGGFAEYVDAARRRLASHGFDQAFQLLEDAAQQDERVTWIEYLEYECWWLDEFAKYARIKKTRLGDGNGPVRLKREYEKAELQEVTQQLRVQWILSEMPPAEDALKTNAPAAEGAAGTHKATGKRRRDDVDEMADEATDETTEQANKRRKQGKRKQGEQDKQEKQGKQDSAQQAVRRKGLPRMLLGLEIPVARTRVQGKDKARRSARIQARKD